MSDDFGERENSAKIKDTPQNMKHQYAPDTILKLQSVSVAYKKGEWGAGLPTFQKHDPQGLSHYVMKSSKMAPPRSCDHSIHVIQNHFVGLRSRPPTTRVLNTALNCVGSTVEKGG